MLERLLASVHLFKPVNSVPDITYASIRVSPWHIDRIPTSGYEVAFLGDCKQGCQLEHYFSYLQSSAREYGITCLYYQSQRSR